MRLFHLVAPSDWPAEGEYAPPSLASEGFVHFSRADQVAGSANLHYADATELVVVEIEADGLPVRVENGFPHVYAPIPVDRAVAVHPIGRDADGRWVFTDGGATAPA